MKSRIQESGVRNQKRFTFARRAALRWFAFVLFVLFTVAAVASGQQTSAPATQDSQSVELYQSLLDLQNPWTVMCVAAHPDDEDGTTLTILRHKYGVHTVSVFSTYGEGGQNDIGPELYEELGAIRARETREAALVQGSEPYFLGLRDFGFSKSADEAFKVWGHDEALRRMVLKIRELRPDVIITNHDTLTGHGHHQATGRLVLEAFEAAADPQRFPEQLKNNVTPWQVKRLFVRFQFEGSGSKAAEEEALRAGKVVLINPNERDPVRGTTYAEQALQALQHHATQGPWPKTLPPNGRPVIRYRLAREAKDAALLPANSQTVLDGLRLTPKVASLLAPPTINGRPLTEFVNQPDRVLDALLSARKSDLYDDNKADNADAPRFLLMNFRLDIALAKASGITLTVKPHDEVLIPNTTSAFTVTVSNQGHRKAKIVGALFDPQSAHNDFREINAPLAPKAISNLSFERKTPGDAQITVPHAAHLYDEKPFGQRILTVIGIDLNGALFSLPNETYLDVAPAVEISSVAPSPYVITPVSFNQPLRFRMRLINHQNKPFKGALVIKDSTGQKAEGGTEITLAPNETREFTVRANGIRLDAAHADTRSVLFSVHSQGNTFPINDSETHVVYSDARVVPNLHVGYISSFDETLKHSLAALGVEAKELTVDDVRGGDLSRYSAIIIDNRGYQAHPELVALNSRLLDYVHGGGTLIVFYHKMNEWNPDQRVNRPQLAPYPITLGGSRVTDENAPIEFTDPQHPLLNFPNKITQADFAGWIQERGLYYPQEWDKRYSAPLSMNDPGEAPLRGGLLATDYGRGHYIYTSMVWYRQLRAGVPGAYRVLANMVSYGREDKR